MADIGLRDLGAFIPGGRSKEAPREPVVPPIPPRVVAAEPPVIVTPPPPAPVVKPVFVGDRGVRRDALGVDPTLAQIAELVAHRGTEAPLCVALLGAPGTGKSFALRRLAARIGELAAASEGAGQTLYVSRVHVQEIDAASLDGDPALALAARLHAGLRQAYPDLAREIGAAARDPQVVLREASEKLDEARRRLDSERRALDEAGARRARLTETVLYESAGSQVDAYVRANRSAIESRLTAFGLTGEPVRTFKDLVQLVAGSGGRLGLVLRSLWAYKGQTKLIVLALLLVAIGTGLGIAVDQQNVWLADLRSGPKAGTGLADWFTGHMNLVATAHNGAFALAALAIVVNILRAVNFLRPIFRGAQLLDSDLDNRRRDLDGLYAHQTKRVDVLERDVERLGRDVTEAERRAGGTGTSLVGEPSPFETSGDGAQAQSIFNLVGNAVATGAKPAQSRIAAPQRIVLALDHLDTVLPERARAIFDALHRLTGPGFVTLAAVDPTRLDPKGLRRNELERWIQVPVRLEVLGQAAPGEALVRDALGLASESLPPTKPDPRRSEFDQPITDAETALLSSLAELAGRTPRAVKRFVNLYRLARTDTSQNAAAVALMLAVAQGGTDAERKAVADATSGEAAAAFDLSRAEPRLRAAYDAVVAAGGRLSTGEAAEAARRAAVFALV